MGKQQIRNVKPFTMSNVKNKSLVIDMLKFEEAFTKSDQGQSFYKNPFNRPYVSLDILYTINRIVLDKFDFDTSDKSVENYRTIFKTYFISPDNYDKDVIQSVHYMRENKCIFYKHPPIKIGQKIPNCELTGLDGKTKTSLHDVILSPDGGKGDYTVFAAFSLS